MTGVLNHLHIRGLFSLGTLGFIKLDIVTFLKLASFNFIDVYEQILAAPIGLNETKTFLIEEPCYFSCCHNRFL